MSNDRKFLLCSADPNVSARLSELSDGLGVVHNVLPDDQALLSLLEEGDIDLVFFDFEACDSMNCRQCDTAVKLTQMVARQFPQVGRVAIGRSEDSKSVMRALRAGVHEFIDLTRNEELIETLHRALTELSRSAATQSALVVQPKANSVLLMGARPGVGSSTAAVHLAVSLQKKLSQSFKAQSAEAAETEVANMPLKHRVCLVDLGWPTGDSGLYLNLASGFDFIKASKEVHRLDETLLKSALPQHPSGMNSISLPADQNEVRAASLKDCLQLCNVLAQHFGVLVIEANGFPNPNFLKAIAEQVDDTWLVCDQNMASLVAASELLTNFEEQHIKLVLNRYDERAGLVAKEIAERFKVELLAQLPDRGWEMVKAANLAELVNEGSERDPYNNVISSMAATVYRGLEHLPANNKTKFTWLTRWVNRAR